MKKDEGRVSKIAWRPASTVVLAREEKGELQVYLLQRSGKSGFFPGSYVFPGGAVDTGDGMPDRWEDYVDLTALEIWRRLGNGISFEAIMAYCATAIRETFEEAGVFLGHRKMGGRDTAMENLWEKRRSEELTKGWLWKAVMSGGWILGFSLLARWAHWLTPELMTHHFDTRFFVALMPGDQTCIPDSRETTKGIWVSPKKALGMNLETEIPLSPPTVVTLHELMAYESLEELKRELNARPWGEPRFPRLVRLQDGALILQPWDPQRHADPMEIDPKELEKAVLPVGEPFSRLWLKDGIWKPVGY
ncbi:MAG: hypothetical protein JRJ29_08530 [Deltaproteobacteria bacterium]|nr:hypothetical protein [Deltaproteobacteria bacterium]